MISRRNVLVLGMALGPAAGAWAQPVYPNRPIRWILPGVAGSPIDAIARKLGEIVSKRLGAPIVIDNKPGASGTIGAAEVARASADGYTMMFSTGDALVAAVATVKIPYDPQKDFKLISKVAAAGAVLIATKSLKPNDLPELVALAKSSGQPMSYGSYGPGSYPQQIMESFARQAGIKLTEVPYKGSPPATNDLLAGHLALSFTSAHLAAPLLAEGKLKALAIVSDARSPLLPKVPTFAEGGFDAFVFKNKIWVGLSGPAGMPDAVVQKVGAAVQEVAADPGFRQYLANIGFDLVASSPAEFLAEYRAEFAVIPALIKSLGVVPQ